MMPRRVERQTDCSRVVTSRIKVTVTLYITLIVNFKFGIEMPTLLISLAVSLRPNTGYKLCRCQVLPARHLRSLDTVTLGHLSQIPDYFSETTSRHLLSMAADSRGLHGSIFALFPNFSLFRTYRSHTYRFNHSSISQA